MPTHNDRAETAATPTAAARRKPAPPRLSPAWERLLIVVFVAALVAPGAGMVLGWDQEVARGENRALARFPAMGLDWTTLKALPDGLTRYFEDHFAFRPRLVRWQAAFRQEVLGVSPSPSVATGRDGWLFFAEDGAVEDYSEAMPFTVRDLEMWRLTLQHTQDWLQARGIAYVFVLTPDKHAIYPEFVPASLQRIGAQSRTDQLVAYLRQHSTVRIVDVRESLLRQKPVERLYHRTDTHWNDLGALVAYQQILLALNQDPALAGLPPFVPASRDAFVERELTAPGMDLAGMQGLADVIEEQTLTLVPKRPRAFRVVHPTPPSTHWMDPWIVTEIPGSTLPRAVVYRDSFGAALVPFLSEHFSRVAYSWEYDMSVDIVLAEQPKVVIQQWVGRRLSTLLPYDPIAGMNTKNNP